MKSLRYYLSIPAYFLLAGAAYAQPVITGVFDAYAVTVNIAPGSVFAVKGTGLSPSGYKDAPPPIYPTTLNNVQMSLTSANGGAAIPIPMVYTYNYIGDTSVPVASRTNQLAALIPSTVQAGAYDLRVTNGASVSAPFRTTVITRKPGIATADFTGSGIAQATLEGKLILQRNSNVGKIGDFDTRPAHPGDVMTLWVTGLGPDIPADTGGTSGDVTAAAQVRVVLNGADIIPQYAGRSGTYPGLDQVNFKIPNDVPLKCDNTVQVRAGGVVGNLVTIATSAATDSACPPPTNPGGGGGSTDPVLTQSEINSIIASGQYRQGTFTVDRLTSYQTDYTKPGNPITITTKDTATAGFNRVSGIDLPKLLSGTLPLGFQVPAHGVCNIFFAQNVTNPYPNLTYTPLDAGSPLSASGPAGSRSIPRLNIGSQITYNSDIGNGTPGNFMDSGSYTFTGPGGPNVGSFSGSVNVASNFVVTNAAVLKTVNRASGLTITWTGGEPTGLVFISGNSFVSSGTGVSGGSFQCYANNSAGQFTVPASVLIQLPASSVIVAGPISFTIPGSLGVGSVGKSSRVQANGLDLFTVGSDYNYAFNPLYQ